MSAELLLEPTAQLPRLLVLKLTESRKFVADMYVQLEMPLRRLSFVYADLAEWCLDIQRSELSLDTTSIPLSDTEVEQVRHVFGHFGLRIHGFPTAAPLGTESAKVAACASLPPSARGTTRPSVCTGGRALEFEAETLAYALTNGECY